MLILGRCHEEFVQRCNASTLVRRVCGVRLRTPYTYLTHTRTHGCQLHAKKRMITFAINSITQPRAHLSLFFLIYINVADNNSLLGPTERAATPRETPR